VIDFLQEPFSSGYYGCYTNWTGCYSGYYSGCYGCYKVGEARANWDAQLAACVHLTLDWDNCQKTKLKDGVCDGVHEGALGVMLDMRRASSPGVLPSVRQRLANAFSSDPMWVYCGAPSSPLYHMLDRLSGVR